MKSYRPHALLALGISSLGFANAVQEYTDVVRFRSPGGVTADSLHNIHVEFESQFEGHLQFVYGGCGIEDPAQNHHEIGNTFVKRGAHPERFVWATPSDTPSLDCLHAFSGTRCLGRSPPIHVSSPIKKRENIADVADAMGPWFDGVAYMKSKTNEEAFVTRAKNSSVAIIGGGISGLMTSLLLESVGIHNWHIYESSERIGGRIRTKYLNNTRPDEYQYQEMGAMRFPVSITYADTNETLEIQDHRMVFQLADVLNKMNADQPDLAIEFIPWHERGPNLPANSGGHRLPNGRIPSAADVTANRSLVYTPTSAQESVIMNAESAYENLTNLHNKETLRAIGKNMYTAHKQAVESGLLDWSEAGYLQYAKGYNYSIVDKVTDSYNFDIWQSFYYEVYHASTELRTIDKGVESLPRAFTPHIEGKITLNHTVEGLIYNETNDKIAIAWRKDPLQMIPETIEYDHAVVTVPFTKVRLWDLPRFSSVLNRAISTLNYAPACKIALNYKTRFWEHLEAPIFGGCGSVDVPGIGDICYPSYNTNGTGSGVVLASYIFDAPARSIAALSDEEHVALAQRTMVEVHGEIAAEQFTGHYERKCWETDRHQAGAWADPVVGQQKEYLPAYYQTEFKTIFVGEHTSYTHAWVFSALDSTVRGTAQLLLDLGLVDEAKEIVQTWMGRWIRL
jgi:monoamine oxidase